MIAPTKGSVISASALPHRWERLRFKQVHSAISKNRMYKKALAASSVQAGTHGFQQKKDGSVQKDRNTGSTVQASTCGNKAIRDSGVFGSEFDSREKQVFQISKYHQRLSFKGE